MAGFAIFVVYALIGTFWGRIYYNRETKHWRSSDGREEVLGFGVACIWPLWVGFHIIRMTMLAIFKLADFASGKISIPTGLGGGR